VLNFPAEFVRGIRLRLGFIDVGVKYICHYLPDRVTYAASDVQPVAFCAINLAALCSVPKLQTEMYTDVCWKGSSEADLCFSNTPPKYSLLTSEVQNKGKFQN
jgi:hypothetical protein